VRVVVDKSNATARYSAATFLANQGVQVRVDYRYAIMHDKFIEVDGETLETGSFNFTSAAEKKNAENVLVLQRSGCGSTIRAGMGSAVGRVGGDGTELLSRWLPGVDSIKFGLKLKMLRASLFNVH
jgi:phosphatidylserine/phosphatidylglycerophosphate/cardiolipin synthase-like enzyme